MRTRDERGGGEGALERKSKGRGPDVPPRDGRFEFLLRRPPYPSRRLFRLLLYFFVWTGRQKRKSS